MTTEETRATVRLLGDVAVRTGADGWDTAGPAKRAAVLSVLAMSAGRPVTAEQLIDRVWGEDVPSAARSALYAHITRLRRLLAPCDAPILRTPGGYRLALDEAAVDLFAMRDLTVRGTTLLGGGEPAEALRSLRRAESMWHGTPLSNVESPWADRVRVGLERERLSLAEARFDAELACGNHAGILDALRTAAHTHPESERLTGQAMTALYRCGRQSEAVAVYQTTLRRLRDELGLEPGRDLRDLYRRILNHDLEQPPRPVSRPNTSGPAAPVRQLPAVAAGFVPRADADAALARLASVTDGGVTPIGLITGMAGVGKTATALNWAHRHADSFTRGQLFADLGGFGGEPRDAAEILAGFLLALGVDGNDIPVDLAARTAAFRSHTAVGGLLVLLDNAATAEQVRRLVPAGPGSLVLVTSRDSLSGLVAVDGAHRVGLKPLDGSDAERVLARQLGEERARDEAGDLAELAMVCGGLPLALRIAAANLNDHPQQSAAELVRELSHGDRLASLSVPGDPTAAIRVAFAHSLGRLDDFTAAVFAAVGQVPGPTVPAAAVAAMLGAAPSRVGTVLRELVAAHLAHHAAAGHVGQHDLLKEYARERVAAADRTAMTDRLFDWYVHAARRAAETFSAASLNLPAAEPDAGLALPELADPAAAVRWFESEKDNVMAVVHAAAERHHPAGWLLPEAMRMHLMRQADYPSWYTASRAGLRSAVARDDPRATAAMHYQLALHAKLVNDGHAVAEHLASALTAAETAGDRPQIALVHASLADTHYRDGRLDDAIAHCHRVLELEPLPQRQLMIALNVLGYANRELGELERSRDALERNVELLSRDGDHKMSSALENLADTYLDMGEYDRALDCAERAVAASAGTGAFNRATTLATLARVQMSMGDVPSARRLAREALDLIDDPAFDLFRPAVLVILAICEADDAEASLRHAREVVALSRERSLPWLEAEGHVVMAEALSRLGRLDDAVEAALAARRRAERHGFVRLRAQALTVLADVHAVRGETGEALTLLRRAAKLHRRSGHRGHLSKVEPKLAELGD